MRRATQARVLRGPAATFFACAIAFTIAACAAAPPVVADSTVRIIVRFKPAVLDPLDPAFLTRLAAQSRVTRIDPIRTMSGEAFVMQVACTDPQAASIDDPCTPALARLRAADAVLYLDVDRREKHQ